MVSELLAAGVPTVSAYKTSWPTYAILRFGYFRAAHFTLANIAAGAAIVPEFAQHHVRPETMAAPLLQWLSEPNTAQAQAARQTQALDHLRPSGPDTPASARAAQALLSFWAAWSAARSARPPTSPNPP